MISYEKFLKEVGLQLRFAMLESGMGVQQLADKAKLSRYTVSRVLGGRSGNLHTVWVICKALNSNPGLCITGICSEQPLSQPEQTSTVS